MSTQRMHPWGEGPVPAVDPAELKGAWDFQERARGLKGEITKPEEDALVLELVRRSLKPEETNPSVDYRNFVLTQMIQFSQLDLAELTKLGLAGMKALPVVDNSKPSDAMLKAIAKVPMESSKFPPFDMEELTRLIKEESSFVARAG